MDTHHFIHEWRVARTSRTHLVVRLDIKLDLFIHGGPKKPQNKVWTLIHLRNRTSFPVRVYDAYDTSAPAAIDANMRTWDTP